MAGEAIGTTWSARIVAAPAEAQAAIESTIARQVMALSQWEPRSALSAFNRAAIGEWVTLDPDLAAVVDAGLAISRASGGAFDVAGGKLTDLWGFGPPGRADVPSDADVADPLARPGVAGIERSGDRARRVADVALDLSGIGKGYIVDRVADALTALGACDFLVEIGGEFVGRGVRPDAQPWWVELENPPGLALPPLRVAAHGVAVATSGDYRRFIERDGRRLSHTIDPRTGRPVENGVASVSVIASDCMTADAWATALTVLGIEEGMTVAAREGLAARMVSGDGIEHVSPTLQAMLE